MSRNKNIPPIPLPKPYRSSATRSQGEPAGFSDNQPHNVTANDHEISKDMFEVLKE